MILKAHELYYGFIPKQVHLAELGKVKDSVMNSKNMKKIILQL